MILYKKITTPVFLFFMLLFCVPGGIAASGHMTEKDFTERLEKALKENPNLIIDILRSNSQAAMAALNEGQRSAMEDKKNALIKSWDAEINSPKAIALSNRPIKGYSGAPVLIAVFSDFTCPYCARTAAIIDDALAQNPATVRFIFKHRPLASHQYSKIAAQYFVAASMQNYDKAWALYYEMFNHREELAKKGEPVILPLAEKVGLDTARLKIDISSSQVAQILKEDIDEANRFGFDGAPYILVNNLVIPGAPSSEILQKAIDKAKKGK